MYLVVTKFSYNSTAPQVISTVIRQKNVRSILYIFASIGKSGTMFENIIIFLFQGYGQTVYSRVPLANGTRTTQCVDLLLAASDELCVIFHSTATTTKADVNLYYRATTKAYGTEVILYTHSNFEYILPNFHFFLEIKRTSERKVHFTPNDVSKN